MRWDHLCEMAEATRDDIPDFSFDLVDRLRGINDSDAIRFACCQFAIGGANGFVEVDRFLFHPVDSGRWTDAPQHARARGLDIDIEDER